MSFGVDGVFIIIEVKGKVGWILGNEEEFGENFSSILLLIFSNNFYLFMEKFLFIFWEIVLIWFSLRGLIEV